MLKMIKIIVFYNFDLKSENFYIFQLFLVFTLTNFNESFNTYIINIKSFLLQIKTCKKKSLLSFFTISMNYNK